MSLNFANLQAEVAAGHIGELPILGQLAQTEEYNPDAVFDNAHQLTQTAARLGKTLNHLGVLQNFHVDRRDDVHILGFDWAYPQISRMFDGYALGFSEQPNDHEYDIDRGSNLVSVNGFSPKGDIVSVVCRKANTEPGLLSAAYSTLRDNPSAGLVPFIGKIANIDKKGTLMGMRDFLTPFRPETATNQQVLALARQLASIAHLHDVDLSAFHN